jgi:glycine betaine/proline transport system ATP-binding protein
LEYTIEVSNLCKLYGLNKAEAARMLKAGASKEEVYRKTGVITALWDVNFKVRQGEIFAIIGLSGSGKSTLLRCMNMLNHPTFGHVLYEGLDIAGLGRKDLLEFRRNMFSMVFQSFGLMDHRDVLGNVVYGLEIKKIPKTEREKTAMEMIEMVGLSGLEHQPIASLSGGMRQRVGIARALANNPKVLLMDEPFSALDPLVRNDMQFELLSLQRKLEKTVIFITHDINEAFKLGDTVAIMNDGRIIQVDTPELMSAQPATDYVRRFVNFADKTKVLKVKHVMTKPSCIVRPKDTLDYAIEMMCRTETSSSYVIDEKLRFRGIITIDGAVHARDRGDPLAHIIRPLGPSVTEDSLISEIIPIAAKEKYPLPVLDEDGRLLGIVNRASVLASLI